MYNKLNEELEELATNILVQYDMLKTPVDVVEIANQLEIEIYETELKNEISGAIRYNENSKKFEIMINENNSLRRKRFTIAHELGHYFLHKQFLKDGSMHIDVLYRNSENKLDEQKIDYFAGALLMNRILLEKFSQETDSVTELAEIFDVSESAMIVRLSILGLLQ